MGGVFGYDGKVWSFLVEGLIVCWIGGCWKD